MRIVLASLLALTASLASGCFACGGWDGAGNEMLSSSTGDAILVCANGTYSAMLANGEFTEGWAERTYAENGFEAWELTDGETRAHRYAIQTSAVGMSSPELGGTWSYRTMDQVERDHADVLCDDVETRSWWSAPQ